MFVDFVMGSDDFKAWKLNGALVENVGCLDVKSPLEPDVYTNADAEKQSGTGEILLNRTDPESEKCESIVLPDEAATVLQKALASELFLDREMISSMPTTSTIDHTQGEHNSRALVDELLTEDSENSWENSSCGLQNSDNERNLSTPNSPINSHHPTVPKIRKVTMPKISVREEVEGSVSTEVPDWYSLDGDRNIDPDPSRTTRKKLCIPNLEKSSTSTLKCPVCHNTLVQDKRRPSM